MKSTGVIRKIDELGRIVIPKEIRKKLEINIKDPMEIYVEGHGIMLKKIEDTCVFCDNKKDLINFKNKLICQKCFESLYEENKK